MTLSLEGSQTWCREIRGVAYPREGIVVPHSHLAREIRIARHTGPHAVALGVEEVESTSLGSADRGRAWSSRGLPK